MSLVDLFLTFQRGLSSLADLVEEFTAYEPHTTPDLSPTGVAANYLVCEGLWGRACRFCARHELPEQGLRLAACLARWCVKAPSAELVTRLRWTASLLEPDLAEDERERLIGEWVAGVVLARAHSAEITGQWWAEHLTGREHMGFGYKLSEGAATAVEAAQVHLATHPGDDEGAAAVALEAGEQAYRRARPAPVFPVGDVRIRAEVSARVSLAAARAREPRTARSNGHAHAGRARSHAPRAPARGGGDSSDDGGGDEPPGFRLEDPLPPLAPDPLGVVVLGQISDGGFSPTEIFVLASSLDAQEVIQAWLQSRHFGERLP